MLASKLHSASQTHSTNILTFSNFVRTRFCLEFSSVMRRYLRDHIPTFSCSNRTPTCYGQTDRHTTSWSQHMR